MIKYKNFDLSFLIQGAHGQKIYRYEYDSFNLYHEGRNYLAENGGSVSFSRATRRWLSYKLNRNTNHFLETQGSSYC